ncbi:MAG: hypothetical protein H7124_14520 [Phycisphaerales bacterium]|nr:hypothetical protein [Hyphomonadaceae bacterium]
MNVADYEVVFNLAREPFDGWQGIAFSAIFVLIGVAMAAFAARTWMRAFGVVYSLFAIAVSIMAGLGSWQHYQRLQADFREGRFSDIEGIAEHSRNPRDPSDSDILRIGSQRFDLVGPMRSAAYHRNLNYGGFDMSGRCIRIFYTDRREIIWLGIRKSGCEPNESLRPDADRIGLWDP